MQPPEASAGRALVIGAPSPTSAAFSRPGFLSWPKENAKVNRLVDRLSIRPANLGALVRTLSRCNLVGVSLAKWLSRQLQFFILDEPTSGVDVGSNFEICGLIGDFVERRAGGRPVFTKCSGSYSVRCWFG